MSLFCLTSLSTILVLIASVVDHGSFNEDQVCAMDDEVFDEEQLSSILDISLIIGH